VPGKDIWPNHAGHSTCNAKHAKKWDMLSKYAEQADKEIQNLSNNNMREQFLNSSMLSQSYNDNRSMSMAKQDATSVDNLDAYKEVVPH